MTNRHFLPTVEKTIDSIAHNHADQYHGNDERKQLLGTLDAALILFDNLIVYCKDTYPNCYTLGERGKYYLNLLTITKCIQLKVYYMEKELTRCRHSRGISNTQYIFNQLSDFCGSSCHKLHQISLQSKVLQDLRSGEPDILRTKAFYAHLADTSRDPQQNWALALDYLREVVAILEARYTFDPSSFIAEYADVMSAYEFLGIACAARS